MYLGGFLLLTTANTLTAGLGRMASTSLYCKSFPLNRSETFPSNHSLTTTFCRRSVKEGWVRTNCQGPSNIYAFGPSKSYPPFPCLGLFNLGLFDKPGLDLLPESVGVTFDVDGRGAVQNPVQDGGGDHRVAEDLVPLREAPVRGQDTSKTRHEHLAPVC